MLPNPYCKSTLASQNSGFNPYMYYMMSMPEYIRPALSCETCKQGQVELLERFVYLDEPGSPDHNKIVSYGKRKTCLDIISGRSQCPLGSVAWNSTACIGCNCALDCQPVRNRSQVYYGDNGYEYYGEYNDNSNTATKCTVFHVSIKDSWVNRCSKNCYYGFSPVAKLCGEYNSTLCADNGCSQCANGDVSSCLSCSAGYALNS